MSKMTTRRKLAIASWSAPKEGNIYGKLTIDAGNAQTYLDELRKTSGEKVTITAESVVASGDASIPPQPRAWCANVRRKWRIAAGCHPRPARTSPAVHALVTSAPPL